MNKVKAEWILATSYILLFAAVIYLYIPTREIMIVQTAWINIVKSNMTLNIFLLFFIWGMFVDKFTKKLSRKKGWLIWGIGLLALILILKFAGGFPTIFG